MFGVRLEWSLDLIWQDKRVLTAFSPPDVLYYVLFALLFHRNEKLVENDGWLSLTLTYV